MRCVIFDLASLETIAAEGFALRRVFGVGLPPSVGFGGPRGSWHLGKLRDAFSVIVGHLSDHMEAAV